jgi:hypothetical protein
MLNKPGLFGQNDRYRRDARGLEPAAPATPTSAEHRGATRAGRAPSRKAEAVKPRPMSRRACLSRPTSS